MNETQTTPNSLLPIIFTKQNVMKWEEIEITQKMYHRIDIHTTECGTTENEENEANPIWLWSLAVYNDDTDTLRTKDDDGYIRGQNREWIHLFI